MGRRSIDFGFKQKMLRVNNQLSFSLSIEAKFGKG